MPGGRIELPTRGFSVRGKSAYNLCYILMLTQVSAHNSHSAYVLPLLLKPLLIFFLITLAATSYPATIFSSQLKVA